MNWRRLLGIVVTLVSLALALQQVDGARIISVLRNVEYPLLGLAFGLVMISTASSVARWQLLLQMRSDSFGLLFRAFMIAHVLNAVYPAKLGTLVRAHLAGEMTAVDKTFALGTVFAEKVLDGIAALSLFLLLLPVIPRPTWLYRPAVVSAAVLVPTLLVLVVLIHWRQRLRYDVIEKRFPLLQRGWRRTLWTHLAQGFKWLSGLESRGVRWSITFLTLIMWGSGWFINQLALWALSIDVPWVVALLLLVVLRLGTGVPSAPGNIGVFHYLCILTLGLFDVEPSLAFSYGVVLHLLVMILPTFVGITCLWMTKEDIWHWRRAVASPEGVE
jgi:uncharacterized protein (TIRG00374 family)